MWDSYRLCDSAELTEAKWAAQRNWLRITALTRKLEQELDPLDEEWDETASQLFEAQERQKELALKAERLEQREDDRFFAPPCGGLPPKAPPTA